MALKLITAAVKAMAKGGVAGGAAGAAGKLAGNFLGGREETEIEQASDQVKKETQVVSKPPVVSTETPQAVRGFAAMVQKEVEIAERVENEERALRVYSGLQRESSIATLLKGLKSSAIVLESKAKFALNDIRKKQLENKREAEEQKLEGEGLGDIASEVFGKVGNFAGNVKNGILAALSPFMTPALLFGGAFLAEKIQDLLPERFKDTKLEDVLGTIDFAADKIASLAGVAGMQNLIARVGSATSTTLARAGIIKPPTPAAGGAAARLMVGKFKPVPPRFQGFLTKLSSAYSWFAKLQQSSNGIVAKFAQWTASLPKKLGAFLKRAGGKILKWFLIFEAVKALYNATQLLILGNIDETEWHRRNKEQITKIIQLFGGPFLVMAIFAAAGTVVPVLGNLAGGLAGLIVGVILGDSVFNILKINVLVEGLYEMLFEGKWDKLKSFIPQLIKSVGYELPKMIAEATLETFKALTVSPLKLAVEAATTDRVATDEEITEEYGADISSSQLLQRATEGMGTDENAILYAFKDIDTPEKYMNLKTEFEENVLPEINKRRTRKIETMENYLRKEMSEGEYKQLMQQVTGQMQRNETNETTALNDFFRDVGYEEIQLIPGIDDVTEEQLEQYNRGELVDVVIDGEKVLMTRQELREADIGNPLKNAARAEADMRRRQYQESTGATASSDSEETVLQQADSEDTDRPIFATLSEAKFAENDNEGFRAYNDRKTKLRIEYRTKAFREYEEANGKPPTGLNRTLINDEAEQYAEAIAQREFKDQILAANAGTLVSETAPQQQTVNEPRREAVATGSQSPATPERNTDAIIATNERIDQSIIPTVQQANKGIAVLNQVAIAEQKRNLPPTGTEGPSIPTTASPSRRTVDSFLDIGYAT